MVIEKANTRQLLELKKTLKDLLKSRAGRDALNQRYGRDLNFKELSEKLDKKHIVWTAYKKPYKTAMVVELVELVGFAELSKKDEDTFELGYFIVPKYQNLGYGYRLAKKCFTECKNNTTIKNLIIEAENNNIGSLKIMKKLEKEFPVAEISTNENYDPPTIIYKWKF